MQKWRFIYTDSQSYFWRCSELAEEKSQSLHPQKLQWWAQQIYVTKEKIITLNVIITLYAGPKYFDKLKPEPGPTRKTQSDL